MVTELGILLRKIRSENQERLLDMAARLGVSSSFLSAVEMGRKSPPESLEEKIIEGYGCEIGLSNELRRLADLGREVFTLKPSIVEEREAVGMFARRMGELSVDQLKEIQWILSREEEK